MGDDGYADEPPCPYCESTSVPEHDDESSHPDRSGHESEAGSDAYTPAPVELGRATEIELCRQEDHTSAVHEHVSDLCGFLVPGDVVWMEKTCRSHICSLQQARGEGDDREGHRAGKRLFEILGKGDGVLIRKRAIGEAWVELEFGRPIPDLWRDYVGVSMCGRKMQWTAVSETPLPDEQLTLMYGWP